MENEKNKKIGDGKKDGKPKKAENSRWEKQWENRNHQTKKRMGQGWNCHRWNKKDGKISKIRQSMELWHTVFVCLILVLFMENEEQSMLFSVP